MPENPLPRGGLLGGDVGALGPEGGTLREYPLPGVPFKASYWSVPPGGRSPEESHAVHEIWFVAGGQARLNLGSGAMDIRGGQAVYIVPHTSHEAINDGTTDLTVFSVWWP
ncbi:MAG TPA: cupin domain-containing protein [Actinophytocola sp.]|uniref:cupin domain-containing protein n=1 Tax=Actinophytocola sp. TaxID=1872138 RepID=UPI002DDCB590|nr:cupin domain-containing protein [Actinophytocola sp.]HEV2783897.1 cupin domain-containing protein [Actinophytocola sp.]